LRAAEDAVHLDTSALSVDQVVDMIVGWATGDPAGAGG
jgi:cytidylate kinase